MPKFTTNVIMKKQTNKKRDLKQTVRRFIDRKIWSGKIRAHRFVKATNKKTKV